jgi:16S rRNA (uracil1498-N3)-methyltransferase
VNLILLRGDDFIADDRARLTDRRLTHIREVHRASSGDHLRVGVIDGQLGVGEVLTLDARGVELRVRLDQPPPPPLPITLVLALPRPPSLRKALTQATTMGVKRLCLIGAARVEPSFWSSSALRPAALEQDLLLGLEQARDTVRPQVEQWPDLRRFFRERWPELRAAGTPLLADLDAADPCPSPHPGPTVVVIGPEGGFIPPELARWQAEGCRPISLGPRPLRVETAVVALLARLAR